MALHAELSVLHDVVLFEYAVKQTARHAELAACERGWIVLASDGETWLPTREGLRAFFEWYVEEDAA
jgi:hypothetical protein